MPPAMSATASTIAATWPTERHFIPLILLGLLLFRMGVATHEICHLLSKAKVPQRNLARFNEVEYDELAATYRVRNDWCE